MAIRRFGWLTGPLGLDSRVSFVHEVCEIPKWTRTGVEAEPLFRAGHQRFRAREVTFACAQEEV